jgi:hypothetical protein
MKLNCLLLCVLPLISVSCASYDVAKNGECIPLERDEVRRYDDPRVVSSDPDSFLNDVAMQKGRVGMVAARF